MGTDRKDLMAEYGELLVRQEILRAKVNEIRVKIGQLINQQKTKEQQNDKQ